MKYKGALVAALEFKSQSAAAAGNAVPRTAGAVGEHRGDDTEDRLRGGEALCWSLGACLAQKHKRRRTIRRSTLSGSSRAVSVV